MNLNRLAGHLRDRRAPPFFWFRRLYPFVCIITHLGSLPFALSTTRMIAKDRVLIRF